MLLDAFSIISKRYPDYQLVIYGEGPQKEILVNKAEKLKIADQVYFPGYVKNLREKILESHIFVLTSNYEGMPNVLMEAMSLGKPVISTDCAIGGPKFLIENGQNGLLVPTNHSNKLVEALEKIIDDAEFAKKLGENAFNINDRLAPDKIYSIWEKYIEEIVNKEE